jgi:hypothetical protein
MPDNEEVIRPEEARGYLGEGTASLGLLKKGKKSKNKRDPVAVSTLGQRAAEKGSLAPDSRTSPISPAGPIPQPVTRKIKRGDPNV